MKKRILLTAFMMAYGFSVLAVNNWFASGGYSNANTFTTATNNTAKIVVSNAAANGDPWALQFCNILSGHPGQVDGNRFSLRFEIMYEGTYDEGHSIAVLTGKYNDENGTAPHEDWQWGNCDEVNGVKDPNGGDAPNVCINITYPVANDWTPITLEGTIGNHGASFIGLQLNFGGNTANEGTFYIRNVEIHMGNYSLNYFLMGENIGNFKYIIYKQNSEAIVRGINNMTTNAAIPSSIEYEGKTYTVTGILAAAFQNCSNLTSITIPNSVTSIGSYAFSGCNGLTTVAIPNSVTSIGSSTFSGCSSLTSVTIPNSVTSISDDAFNGCSSLTSITIPNSVTSIGDHAFNDCSSLTSVTIPNSVTNISYGTFSGCSSLTSVTIPNSVTSISYGTFSGCSNLTSVTIPNSVTSIGWDAFGYCSGLTSVTIGESVSYISKGAFTGCESLRNITCKSLIPPKVGDELLTDDIISDANLYINAKLTCPKDAKLYGTLQPWCNFSNNLASEHVDTIYVISTNAIQHNIKLTSANAKMGMAIGTGSYAAGSVAEIVAIANYGYHFTKWSDGNTNNPRFVNVASDSSFTAQFEVNNYSVLAAANEKEMGKVEGAATYAYLSRTQLKATPNTGYKFKEWSDGETANPREILVYSDTAFTAVFMAIDATVVNESAANAVNINAHGNTIVVENATEEISVYDAMGKLVCRDAINRVRTEITVNGTGVYIVKTGNTAKRVLIK